MREALLADLAQSALRMRGLVRRRFETQAQGLDRLALKLARPAQWLAQAQQLLQALDHRRRRAVARFFEARRKAPSRLGERLRVAGTSSQHRQRMRLTALGARLEALDPSRVLARGYVFVLDGAGQAVLSASAVQARQRLALRWHDGTVPVRALDE
jgi:exodeoxyribonuclease VII large subunit